MHNKFLLQTLALAQTRRGFCAPNPAVGAVLVKNGKVIAEGVHQRAGMPHAEPIALDQAAEQARGATLYISLEPCNHWGKTPPCTDKIIAAGVKQVYFAHPDHNPQVSNKSIAILEQAGIACEYIPIAAVAEFYRSYEHWLKYRAPWVTAKIAISLDGKIAAQHGKAVAITGTKLQQFTHQCRKHSDILLTTSTTLHHDNPALNVRLDTTPVTKPVAILATDGYLAENLQILHTAEKIVLFYNTQITLKNRLAGVNYIGVNATKTGLELSEVLAKLGELGYHDVWVEAGGKCFSALLQQHLINRAYIYLGVKLLGKRAIPAFHGNKELLDKVSQISWQIFDQDAMCCIELGE